MPSPDLPATADVRTAGKRAQTSEDVIAASNALQTLMLNLETSAHPEPPVVARR